MKDSLLKEVLKKTSSTKINTYPLSVPLDLLDILKKDLNEEGIKFTSFIYKEKERLKIYDDEYLVKKYNKNFYQNNSKFGFKVSNDKLLTEKYLQLSGIPTTKSSVFKENELNKAINILENTNKNYVIKPVNLANGLGVYVNVSLDNIHRYWKECIAIQKKRNVKAPQILFQEFIEGFEIRVIVTEGKSLSATLRTPAYVIGDGQSNLEKLIDNKNNTRLKSGFLYNKLIKKDEKLIEYLATKNIKLDFVLGKDDLLILNPVSNLVNGGENIVITDLLNEAILKLAENGVAAIPGIQTAGVDILLNELSSSEGYILEINKAPAFQLNYYPYIGEPQYPMKYIFQSLLLEHKILDDRLETKDINQESLQLLTERYKSLYNKQKQMEKIIEKLEKRI